MRDMNRIYITILTAIVLMYAGASHYAHAFNVPNKALPVSKVLVLSTATVSGAQATGSITFTGQPANNDTVTVGGTAITFVTGSPTGNQVQIAGTTALTEAALLSFLQGSADTNIVKCTYAQGSGTSINLTYVNEGTAGNSFTLAKSSTNISLSGATLSGGTHSQTSTSINTQGLSLVGIQLPAAFTSTTLTFNASVDGSTWQPVYSTTSGTALSYTVAQGHYVAIDPTPFYGVKYLQIITGSDEIATRTLTVSLKGL